MSNMSRRSITPPARGQSPPSLHADRKDKASKRSSKDITTDETISILDPRRFTPTLHANLVSEILALRRDQEERTKQVETLENTLDSSREEQESLKERFSTTAKENRALKRQLALLEGGTESAIGELANERDDAVETVESLRKRLETAQRKIRNQEDDSQRVHDLWVKDKDAWEDEKRKFERKVHVAETRLKTVLEEVAALHEAQMNGTDIEDATGNYIESDVESLKDNDGASMRTMSLTHSVRFSYINNRPGSVRLVNCQSLADELNFDDSEEQTDVDGRESTLSHYNNQSHARNMRRDSFTGRLHHRNQSMESLRRRGSVARGKFFMNEAVLEALEGESEDEAKVQTEPESPVQEEEPACQFSYTETGIQYSPPPSPKTQLVDLESTSPESLVAKPTVLASNHTESEIEANQSRKRVQITPPLIIEPESPARCMVSTASQTVDDPLSPPRTPKSRPGTPTSEEQSAGLVMVSSSTQTVDTQPAASPRRHIPAPITIPPPIPSISIQPPTSRPTTPLDPVLPQHFKHFGCQVNLSSPTTTNEAGTQTEVIKTDKRMAQLPHHLQPSSISSRPTSPNVNPPTEAAKGFSPVPGNIPVRNPRRVSSRTDSIYIPSSPLSHADDSSHHDAYPGNNDNGALSDHTPAPVKRPHRFSSLFAGFDTASSDEGDLGEFGDEELSDSEYQTALSAPRPQSTTGRREGFSPTGTMPGSPDLPLGQRTRSSMKPFSTEVYSSFSPNEKEHNNNDTVKPLLSSAKIFDRSAAFSPQGPSHRVSVMRKAAMIQSGIVSHIVRSRSPSLPESKDPPFPIPTRASSRKPNTSFSAPTSDGQGSPTAFDFWSRRSGRKSHRQNSIRKVRSAAALPRGQRHRHGSRSTPPLSPSTEAPESPGLPPLPSNYITTPRNPRRGYDAYKKHRKQPSNTTEKSTTTDPTSLISSQPTGVVDAIAQTMVGEWMFKYVRRRKSFNVGDNTAKDDTGNDRHKRWVWLAPYERAILWSSKQPSSGSALMGKTGRKLTIQSVLDVKDDNPTPKGVPSVFNRSILILTPQRALKFTATSAERHYVWLTALSFLAHSSQAVPDIVGPQTSQLKPQVVPEYEPPAQTKLKRGGIRDSIRLAKGRTGPSTKTSLAASGVPTVPTIPSVSTSQIGEPSNFRILEAVGAASSGHGHSRESSGDAAEPPMIPRFNERSNNPMVHGRKRSNTGGHVPPPLSFRGFSGPAGPLTSIPLSSSVSSHNGSTSTTANSILTTGSSEYHQSQASSTSAWGTGPPASGQTSDASSQHGNFFDAIGTMRMEAFISPLALPNFGEISGMQDEVRQIVRRRSKDARRRRSRSRHRDSGGYNSRARRGSDDRYGSSRLVGDDDFFRDDPFRGF